MKWRVGQEQISPWPPKEREADLAGEDYFGAAGNGVSIDYSRSEAQELTSVGEPQSQNRGGNARIAPRFSRRTTRSSPLDSSYPRNLECHPSIVVLGW